MAKGPKDYFKKRWFMSWWNISSLHSMSRQKLRPWKLRWHQNSISKLNWRLRWNMSSMKWDYSVDLLTASWDQFRGEIYWALLHDVRNLMSFKCWNSGLQILLMHSENHSAICILCISMKIHQELSQVPQKHIKSL